MINDLLKTITYDINDVKYCIKQDDDFIFNYDFK
jgi:hypothetical protein